MQGVAVGVEAGVDAVLAAGGKPVADKLVLQQGLAAAGGYAAAGGAEVVFVGEDLLHELGHGEVQLFFAVPVPGVAVVAVEAAHEAALHEEDEAQAGAVYGAAGFYGVDVADAFVGAGAGVGLFCRRAIGTNGDGIWHGGWRALFSGSLYGSERLSSGLKACPALLWLSVFR